MDAKLDLIIKKLDSANADLAELKKVKKESDLDKVKDTVRDDVIQFMLKHFNIKSIDDKTEEEYYEWVFDGLWSLTIGKLLPN